MFAGDWLNPLGDFAPGSQDAADSAGQTDAFSYKVRGEHFTMQNAGHGKGKHPKIGLPSENLRICYGLMSFYVKYQPFWCVTPKKNPVTYFEVSGKCAFIQFWE